MRHTSEQGIQHVTAPPAFTRATTTGPRLPSESALRVLHLVPTFTGGGAERQLGYLAAAMAEVGVDVHVAYLREGPNLKLLNDTSVTLHQLQAGGSHDFRLPWMIHRLVRRIGPDVVQSWLPQMDVLGGLVALLNSIPWVLSERSASLAYQSGWKIRLRKIIGRRATAIVANSAAGLDYWQDASVNTLCRTIRNIVPLQDIASSAFSARERSELALDSARLLVGAGRLHPEKNWRVLIEALDIVLKSLPDVQAIIFGEGTLRDALLEQIARSPFANRIHLEGYTDNLWKWFKVASCYVSVSLFEGNPNVLLEALACELPVVVSDIPAHREVLSEVAAEFVPPHSAAAVARAILRVLGDPDANARRKPGIFGLMEGRSASSIAAEYIALYREISRRRNQNTAQLQ
jgi:glycosyltransferase involved in cell wall biosynthesis